MGATLRVILRFAQHYYLLATLAMLVDTIRNLGSLRSPQVAPSMQPGVWGKAP